MDADKIMIAWVGAIAALAGVLVAGILNYFTSKKAFHRQVQWEQDRLIQQKLEEIGRVADEIQHHFTKFMLNIIEAIRSGEFLKDEGDVVPLAKLRLLITFYAPELANHIQLIEEAREKFAGPLIKTTEGLSRDKLERQKINGEVCTAERHMSKACSDLAKAAADLGRKHLRIT